MRTIQTLVKLILTSLLKHASMLLIIQAVIRSKGHPVHRYTGNRIKYTYGWNIIFKKVGVYCKLSRILFIRKLFDSQKHGPNFLEGNVSDLGQEW